MAEVPGVGAIVEGIKARIAQIEEQLRRHRDLSDELDRLRDALGRLEGGVGARARQTRTSRDGVAADDFGRGADGDRDEGRGHDQAAAGGGAAWSDARDGPRGAQERPEDGRRDRRGDRDPAGQREHDAEQARQVRRGCQGRTRLQAARIDSRERCALTKARGESRLRAPRAREQPRRGNEPIGRRWAGARMTTLERAPQPASSRQAPGPCARERDRISRHENARWRLCLVPAVGSGDPGQGPSVGRTQAGRPVCAMGFEPDLFVRPPLRLAWIVPRARIGPCRCPAGSPAARQPWWWR
jgi:hypothetical protein